MAILDSDFFEQGNAGLARYSASGTGDYEVQSAIVYEGQGAVRCHPTAAEIRLFDTFSGSATFGFQIFARRATAAEESPYLFFLSNAADTQGLFVRYESGIGLRLYYYDGGGQTLIATGTGWTQDVWTNIEVRGDVSANPWSINWRIGGSDQTGGSPATAATTISQMNFGVFNYAMTWDAYFDAWRVSDTNEYLATLGAVAWIGA